MADTTVGHFGSLSMALLVAIVASFPESGSSTIRTCAPCTATVVPVSNHVVFASCSRTQCCKTTSFLGHSLRVRNAAGQISGTCCATLCAFQCLRGATESLPFSSHPLLTLKSIMCFAVHRTGQLHSQTSGTPSAVRQTERTLASFTCGRPTEVEFIQLQRGPAGWDRNR